MFLEVGDYSFGIIKSGTVAREPPHLPLLAVFPHCFLPAHRIRTKPEFFVFGKLRIFLLDEKLRRAAKAVSLNQALPQNHIIR